MATNTLPEVHLLIQRIRRGDNNAAAQLVELFGTEVRREIRFFLRNPRLKSLEDSLDVWQSVMKSLFSRLCKNLDVTDAGQLSRLLRAMAKHKSMNVIRRHYAQKQDVRRTIPLPPGESGLRPASDRSPSEIVAMRELFDLCYDKLNAEERKLVDDYGSGKTWVEIAESRKETANAVRKRFDRICDRLKRELRGHVLSGD